MNRRRIGSDAIVLTILFLLFTVIAWRVAAGGGDNSESGRPRRTSYSSKRGGWKAFYQILEQEKVKVSRFTRSPEKGIDKASVIITGPEYFALSATAFWAQDDVKSILSWVSEGGTLILLTDRDSNLTEKIHLSLGEQNPVEDFTPQEEHSQTLTQLQPATFLDKTQAESVRRFDSAYWKKTPPEAIPLLSYGKDKIVALSLPRGDGRIVAIAAPEMADNAHIGQGGNAHFLVQLVADYAGVGKKGLPVFFDEYHQGYTDDKDEEKTLWRVIGRPGRLISLQLLAVALLALYSGGRRFGLARPRPEPPRVSSEYVASLADLYRRAQAGDAALEGLYALFRRDLCRTLGEPPDAPIAEIAPRAVAALSKGNPAARAALLQRLRSLMETCEARIAEITIKTITEPVRQPKVRKGAVAPPPLPPRTKNVRVKGAGVTESELLQLARDIDDMRKELDLGGYADHSG